MIIYKSRFLVRGEVWFDQGPDPTPVDWVFYHQRSQPLPGATCKPFYTLLLDLAPSPEELLRQMNKSTGYEIRRARDKDRITCECINPLSHEKLNAFEETYLRFAAIKSLPPLDRSLLDGLAQQGCLELSVAKNPAGQPLIYHAYYRGAERSRLLHSVSLHQLLDDSASRNAFGRANRFLIWAAMLRHKDQGLKDYDFGGWYPGKTDQGLLDINQFKEGFGGEVVRDYDCELVLTFKGRVVLGAATLLKRIKASRSARVTVAAHRDSVPAQDSVVAASL